jgi:hypothetical protein
MLEKRSTQAWSDNKTLESTHGLAREKTTCKSAQGYSPHHKQGNIKPCYFKARQFPIMEQ